MKKAMSFIMCLAVVMGMTMTGCGKNEELMEAAMEAAKQQASEDAAANAETEATTEEVTEEVTEEATEAATEETTEEVTEEATEAATEAANASSGEVTGDIINFDKMSFMISGYECVLGETTLQDLIDAGVPFDENSIADAGNNVNSNSTYRFNIDIGEHTSNLEVANFTEENMPATECVVRSFSVHVYEDETADYVSFNFPLDITLDDFLAAAGEPDEKDHYVSEDHEDYYTDSLKWQKESELYYGYSYYDFDFTKGVLSYVLLSYMP